MNHRIAGIATLFALLAAVAAGPVVAQDIDKGHGIAMHGDLKYGADFKHFDYADPNAPKGGTVKLHAIGTFDTLNPFTLKGVPADGIGGIYETLLTNSQDEAFSEYGMIAESVEMPADRSWVVFNLRKEARWHDGNPVTAEDVVFSLNTLKSHGRPFYRFYYANVSNVVAEDRHRVRFTFAGEENRELPLIVGQLPILPKHYWEGRDFTQTTLEPPLGSGPYKIKEFETGRSITYERVMDYWGADLPVNKGENNFDVIRYDYYRDATVALEAFRKGTYDFRQENASKDWATGYDSPAGRTGLYKTEEIRHELPTGMQGFAFNTRKAMFQDPRVRRALAFAFDFEWSNENLFYGQYARTESYFSNSELASTGLPSPEELEILEPVRGQIPKEVFTAEYKAPSTAGGGSLRANLIAATKLLTAAGWKIEGRNLVNAATGQPFKFEMLLGQPNFERVVLPFKHNLARIGIEMSVRTVDSAQYIKRIEQFDFDMVVGGWGQSLSPGNEQRDFWGSDAAGREGSRNIIGISDPAIDALIEKVVNAPSREALITRTRALDRVLLWRHFVIPHWHTRVFRVAYWDRFGRPAVTPKYGLGFNFWWVDPARAAALESKKSGVSE
jgi:microcin C transport system substrate-binding protein